ncbi:ABC transporter substrate-binding protein [Lutibaculum baratangense]|uniref:Cobalamin/Fe3+-siderophores transport system, secreted component n=1 Tax=Lutibaculum baratangense AMV1 TaxID=631454 RepID=V4QXR0_9HYPH|nr:ABC transporter substrate-binding protein [Lutibaculum baratangense]ESR24522.1 cobalamin/Fe3+-siderophores transport system, secreted component [Lutibaculum baratangense AMV1]
MGPTRREALAALAVGLLPVRAAGAESLRFAHAYGETVLPAPARRVVSLGYTTHDPLLALGVPPVAVRYWFGDHPFGVWPWAQPYLDGAEPEVLSGEVSMERVAALSPDLIVAIGSGISEAEYAVLSRIAPVLMQAPQYTTYGMPWDETTRWIGRAVGREAEAERRVVEARQAFSDAQARNPSWAGKTAVAAYHRGGETGAFIGVDNRAQFLADLGFRPTAEVARLSGPEEFYVPLSPEDLSPLDADLLVWVSGFGSVEDLAALPMRRTLAAHVEGREVLAGQLAAAAMSHGSVLSMPFALEELEADLAAAADGDPATEVRSASEAGLAP